MSTRYTPLTLDEHIAIGNALKAAKRAMYKVLASHTVKSPVSKKAERVLKALADLRCQLDEEVFRVAPQEIAARVYYGDAPTERERAS